ncbi:MAG TPA: hypothetical protein VF589_02625 [Allosphingosinicella sp.]|jgi:hypothetical protein
MTNAFNTIRARIRSSAVELGLVAALATVAAVTALPALVPA